MKLSNLLGDMRNDPDLSTTAFDEGMRALVIMLAPLAPHAAAELWTRVVKAHSTVEGGEAVDVSVPSAGNVANDDVHAQVSGVTVA